MRPGWLVVWLFVAAQGVGLHAQGCSMCAEWNRPQKPFRIYGNTWYVGPQGLTSLLIVSAQGDVLIDSALAMSVTQVAHNIQALGFRLPDVKLIVSSHVHHDHAGGIAQLQRLTGAPVRASPWSAQVLKTGGVALDDPQYGNIWGIPPAARVSTFADRQTLTVGPLALTPHFTPGHTSGGTSWTWQSCEQGRCLNMVYADSVSTVSRPGFRFTDHPEILAQFARTFAWLDSVPCDVLLTPHPDASGLFARVASGELVDRAACRRLAQDGREALKQRLLGEATKK